MYCNGDYNSNNVTNCKKTLIDGYYDYETEYRGLVHDQSEFEYDGSSVKKRSMYDYTF